MLNCVELREGEVGRVINLSDNLRCECESINNLPFTPEHFIFCGSPNFLPKFMQFIMNFKKLKFSKSSKAFAKVTKIISIITLRKRVTWRNNFLKDFEFNKMQLVASTCVILSRSFGIFLRNLESSITRNSNISNLIMLSQRFKSSLHDSKHFS